MQALQMGTLALLLMSVAAHAGTKEDLAKVHALTAKKISGADVRITTEVYDNTDGNPCAEAGINYIAKVETRRTVRDFDDQGLPSPSSVWNELNSYHISQKELKRGGDVSDAPCME